MAWEDVPADIDNFFKTGELPEGSVPQADPPPADPPAADPPPADHVDPPADPVDPPPVVAPPVSDPYRDELVRRQQNTLDALTKQLNDLQAARDAEVAERNKPVAPDPATDPLGYLTHQIKAVGDQVKAMQEETVSRQNLSDQQLQTRNFLDNVNAQIDAFKAKNPDYLDAYNHLVALRKDDYAIRGLSAAEIQQEMGKEELSIVQRATAQGKNPAQIVYDMAKKYGYQPKAAPAGDPPKDTPESKLERIKKGMETTGTDRSAPPATYSTSAIKDMSDKQLNDAVANHWNEMFERPTGKDIF